ncbi:MAG TPA: cysteine synthase family protein [Holophagaceae bacterium]|nr:cysteine synthase family protein [Holophagaceae bacterium]
MPAGAVRPLVTVESVLDLVGNTPLLHLKRFAPECELFAKLEYLNPGGSVKDRIGVGMILRAQKAGKIKPGVSTIIEPTAGNTGVGLAIAAKALGYRCILCVPTKYSREKMQLMKALGAELVLIPKADGMKGAIAKCAELSAQIPDSFVPQQFENPDNPDSHYETTGPEIWEQMEGRVDAVVIGAGSGGTFTGTARFLKEKNPKLVAVCVQPVGSVYCGAPLQEWKVEGIGNGFIPGSLDMKLVDRVIDVKDEDAFQAAKELIGTEGCLAGPSSGANAWAARELAKSLPKGARIVTLFPDGAERYLSKFPIAELDIQD